MQHRKDKAVNELQNIQTLTRMFIAYFVNKADEWGVSFYSRRIRNPQLMINEELWDKSKYPFVKGEWFFKITAKVKEIKSDIGYGEKIFIRDIVPQIEAQVIDSISAFKELNPNLHIGFLPLPDYQPFIWCTVEDLEEKVKFRGVAGNLFIPNEIGLVFDAHCYFVDEIIKIQLHEFDGTKDGYHKMMEILYPGEHSFFNGYFIDKNNEHCNDSNFDNLLRLCNCKPIYQLLQNRIQI